MEDNRDNPQQWSLPGPFARESARFTDANDHNPIVRENCPRCRGTRKISIRHDDGIELAVCDACNGEGVTDNLVPFFDNDAETIDVVVTPDGWLTCPGCGKRFSTGDQHRWTGRRHRTCGQKINPVRRDD